MDCHRVIADAVKKYGNGATGSFFTGDDLGARMHMAFKLMVNRKVRQHIPLTGFQASVDAIIDRRRNTSRNAVRITTIRKRLRDQHDHQLAVHWTT